MWPFTETYAGCVVVFAGVLLLLLPRAIAKEPVRNEVAVRIVDGYGLIRYQSRTSHQPMLLIKCAPLSEQKRAAIALVDVDKIRDPHQGRWMDSRTMHLGPIKPGVWRLSGVEREDQCVVTASDDLKDAQAVDGNERAADKRIQQGG